MEFEEFQRSMEFLLAQQAQFALDVQRSEERHDRQMAEVMRALMIVGAKLDRLTEANAEAIAERIEADRRLSLSIENVDKRLAESLEGGDKWLRDRMEEGDEWLRKRIDEVDTRLGDRIDEVDQRLGELANAQKETESRLASLLRTLEEESRGRRNGGQPH